MQDILEQVDSYLKEPPVETDDGQEIFDRVVDFIMNLHPDSLTDNQLEEVMDILDNLSPGGDLEEQERTYRLANKSPMKKRQLSRKYNRQNNVEIKKRRVKLSRSLDGRKRKKLKKPMGKRGLTPGGREKVRYHPTMGGPGGKRKKEGE